MKPQDSMTPMSQLSTAANTPITVTSNDIGGFQLPGSSSDDDLFELSSGFNEEATPFAVCLPHLTSNKQGPEEATSLAALVLESELGCWAQQLVEAEEWLEAELPSGVNEEATPFALNCAVCLPNLNFWSRGSDEAMSLAAPVLQSELGCWARQQVEA
jgi:hypothetical protein